MKNVLFLSTYPFVKPRHGGQIRLHNLVHLFKKNGYNTTTIAVYEPESYLGNELGINDIPFPIDSKYRQLFGKNVSIINDFLTGIYAVADDGGFFKILEKLPEKIDIIFVEQCWLWELTERIKEIPKFSKALTIYGSQNIEHLLKKDIIDYYNIKHNDIINKIHDLEKKATLKANIVAAVTEGDLRFMQSFGREDIILAANGIEPWDRNLINSKWQKKLPKDPWMLYVASAHPPNFASFNKIIGDSLACIPPDSKLVIAGSVSEHIYRELLNSKWPDINLTRIQLLYTLSDDDLKEVKNLAHAYLLPIEHGGGSNLKTAEALYSGKYVIGTPSSLRGFEKFTTHSRIRIIKTPQDFFDATHDVFSKVTPELDIEELNLMEELTWERTLQNLFESVEMKMGFLDA